MEKKFTAIYVDSWMSGSHWHSLTKMHRFIQHENETVMQALERSGKGIADATVFIFEGHPKLQGETN